MPKIIIHEPNAETRSIDLEPGTYDVGRSKENDIVLSDSKISRLHAKISYNLEDETFIIEDLESANGVYVNKVKIINSGKLKEGDEVKLGRAIIEIKSSFNDVTMMMKDPLEYDTHLQMYPQKSEIEKWDKMPGLVIYDPTGKIRTVELKPDINKLGKSKKSDVILKDKNASRKHAIISFDTDKGGFIIEDLKSKIGVYVNKIRIQEKEKLNYDDEIRIGGTIIEIKRSFEDEQMATRDAPMVVLNNATKVYNLGKHEVPALQGVNLEVKAGEFISVCGPSGSGKSTLLNLIGCIDSPTSGTVSIMGKDVASFKDAALSKLRNETIGFIFQSFNLVPVLNAFENIEYPLVILGVPKSKRAGKTSSILHEVGLSDFSKHRPDELSGGQRQRVAIARALVTEPEMVLADEPTANLDSKTGLEILDLMKKMNEEHKTTFIFSTHDPKIENYANKIYNMIDGGIIGEPIFSTS